MALVLVPDDNQNCYLLNIGEPCLPKITRMRVYDALRVARATGPCTELRLTYCQDLAGMAANRSWIALHWSADPMQGMTNLRNSDRFAGGLYTRRPSRKLSQSFREFQRDGRLVER